MNKFGGGVNMLEVGWLLDNIHREILRITLFWRDPWIDGSSLEARFSRLFDLADNKLATMVDMYLLR